MGNFASQGAVSLPTSSELLSTGDDEEEGRAGDGSAEGSDLGAVEVSGRDDM